MAEIVVRPRGPYSLALSARLASDATRRVRDGVVTARCCGGVARAWQSPDGAVTIRSESPAGGREAPLRARPGRRPLGVPDGLWRRPVARADDRAPPRLAPDANGDGRARPPPRRRRAVDHRETARGVERLVIRAATQSTTASSAACHAAPTAADLRGAFARPAAEPRTSRAPRRCPRPALPNGRSRKAQGESTKVARRVERERGLGPWSAGVVCLGGPRPLRTGAARDLGLVKLASRALGTTRRSRGNDALLTPTASGPGSRACTCGGWRDTTPDS